MPRVVTIIIMILIDGCAPIKTYTPPHTVKGLHIERALFNRVMDIKHSIFVANSSICSKTRTTYGFISMTVPNNRDGAQKELWIKAFSLQKQPTITHIVPKGAASRSGLHVGDAIISVNNTHWSDAESQDAFAKLLSEARQMPHLRLGILRGGKKQVLNLSADEACDYDLMLSITNRHEARAHNGKIIVDSGAVELLKHDNELAFFISHELAHILLGHTLSERRKELDDYKMRKIMEEDADALGIRLMVHAGYDPKGAEIALKKTDLIDSGPITRLLQAHGPYMDLDDRIQYLRKVVNQ